MNRWCWLAALVLVACKTDKPPRTGTGTEAEPSAPAMSATDEPPAAPTTGSAPGPESPASSADLRTILQLVIDDPELEGYLHLSAPGRFPLQIAGDGLPDGLTKSTQPVAIVSAPAPDAPVIAFTAIEATSSRATVRYRFGAEGIQGTATLEKTPMGWQLVRSRIIER